MLDVYPPKFDPIYKDKIWGGRNLERLFDRALPELEIKPVAGGNHYCCGDQPGQDIHDIMVATLHRRNAKPERDGQGSKSRRALRRRAVSDIPAAGQDAGNPCP